MTWKRGTAPAALASIVLGSVLVVVMLALRGLNSDLPIYAGLGGSLAAYVLVSLVFPRRELGSTTGRV
jgi:solute:Na+ symporter, SSS family